MIIPVLDESARIDACLGEVSAQPCVHEIVVVDGGSGDDTLARARRHRRVRALSAGRGRARQMNAGAAVATGDTLFFVHADVALPDAVAPDIDASLSRPGVVAGAFRTWHVPERWRSRRRAALLHLADVRSRYSALPYGDQGLFLRADTFERAGGFPEVELMEDLAFARRLRELGDIRVLDRAVRVSGRRFESAPVVQTLLVNVFPALYALGVPPRVLAWLYGNPR